MPEPVATVLITGLTEGIGRTLAFAFAEAGYRVVGCARNGAKLDELVGTLPRTHKVPHLLQRCDLVSPNERSDFVTFVSDAVGAPDVLINNAGLYYEASAADDGTATAEQMMQLNFFAAFDLTKRFLKEMTGRRAGRIVNICSVASRDGYEQIGAYCASKHALYGWTKTLRKELAAYDIPVTAILPGAVATASWSAEELAELPAGSILRPEEVAQAVLNACMMPVAAVIEEVVIRPMRGLRS